LHNLKIVHVEKVVRSLMDIRLFLTKIPPMWTDARHLEELGHLIEEDYPHWTDALIVDEMLPLKIWF
jgi:hypothetical protein